MVLQVRIPQSLLRSQTNGKEWYQFAADAYADKYHLAHRPFKSLIPAEVALEQLKRAECISQHTSLYTFTTKLTKDKELHGLLFEDQFLVHPDVLLDYIKVRISKRLTKAVKHGTI